MSGRVAVLVPMIFLASSAVSETFVFDLPFGANTTAIGQSLVFTVRGVTGAIADIDVRLSISHPDTRELAVYFGGRSLGEHIGSGANFQDTYYDMDAFGPRIGEEGANESPFAAPEWGGRRYRPQMDWSDYEQFDPNQEWFGSSSIEASAAASIRAATKLPGGPRSAPSSLSPLSPNQWAPLAC